MDANYSEQPSTVTCAPGAYVLDLRLARPCAFETRLLGPVELPAGRYFYAGSARGPGGLRARVSRHFRRNKSLCWHVDHLTGKAAQIGVVAVPGGHECVLAARLLSLDKISVPLAGFGSSDCNRCPAHLFFWSGGGASGSLVALLAGAGRQ